MVSKLQKLTIERWRAVMRRMSSWLQTEEEPSVVMWIDRRRRLATWETVPRHKAGLPISLRTPQMASSPNSFGNPIWRKQRAAFHHVRLTKLYNIVLIIAQLQRASKKQRKMSSTALPRAFPSIARYASTSAATGKHKVVVIGGGESIMWKGDRER